MTLHTTSLLLGSLLLALFSATASFAGPATTACSAGDAMFTSAPTKVALLAGIVPLGNLNPAGHTLPSRHVYFYPPAAAPADIPVYSAGAVELVAVEYHAGDNDWSLHMKPCKDVTLYYFHIKSLTAALTAAIGPMNVGSYDFAGDAKVKPVSILLAAGQMIGAARTFDVGLMDFRKPQNAFVNKKRYDVDFPALLAVLGWGVDPAATALAQIIAPQALYARCALDYFKAPVKATLTAKLSDHDGVPLASGVPPCHSNMQDVPKSAQGNWFNDTNPTNDALFAEETSLALVNWNVDPTVKLFSLNHNLPGFGLAWLAPPPPPAPDNLDAPFEFPVREGPQLTNRRFAEILDDQIYCYDLVRGFRGGPSINGVILLRVSDGPGGKRTKLTIELQRAGRCPALPTPWAFGGGAATFYR